MWTVRAEAWTEGSESTQVQTRARRAARRWERDQLVFSGDRWPGVGSWQSPSLQLLSRAPAPPCCPLAMGSERAALSTSLSLLGFLWSCPRLLTVDCQELCGGQEMVQLLKCLPCKRSDLLQIPRTYVRARHSVNNPSTSEVGAGEFPGLLAAKSGQRVSQPQVQ